MANSNELVAHFKGNTGVAESLYKDDYGMILVIDGMDMIEPFEVHYEHSGSEEAITEVGADNRVPIPNACLSVPGLVTAYFFHHTSQNDGQVQYVVRFRVLNRARNEDIVIPQAEESLITRAMALLQHPSEQFAALADQASTSASNAAQSASNASTSASLALEYKNNAETARDASVAAKNLAESYRDQSWTAKQNAYDSEGDAEAWAKGTRHGESVPSSDETYQHNAYYYSGIANAGAEDAEQARDRAEYFKNMASISAGEASQSASRANTAANLAEGARDNARTAESAAQGYRDGALNAVQVASSAAGTAQTASGNAQIYAQRAEASAAKFPTEPSADGTYILKLTMSNGVPTYTWVAYSL